MHLIVRFYMGLIQSNLYRVNTVRNEGNVLDVPGLMHQQWASLFTLLTQPMGLVNAVNRNDRNVRDVPGLCTATMVILA